MSFIYRLNSTGETIPPFTTSALMMRHVDVSRVSSISPRYHCFDPLYWLSEKLNWPGYLDTSRILSEEQRGPLPDVDSDPTIPNPELESMQISL
jgi:hypothetical protein